MSLWVVPPRAPRHAERLDLPRVDGNDARAELGELSNDVVPRTLAEGSEENDRGDADRHSEGRKKGAEALTPDCPTNKPDQLD